MQKSFEECKIKTSIGVFINQVTIYDIFKVSTAHELSHLILGAHRILKVSSYDI